ncbi:MAG: transglycosylase SLT domain-containing protein [Bacteroidales bacterium]|nr:transglycosylase SLT domain-containing protein [Bacteroidales bacterium]
MKKTKTLLIIAVASLVLMIIIALVMSIVAIKTANKRPISLEQIVIQSHDIEFCDNIYFAGEKVPLEMFNIRERYERELLSNTYFHSNTMVLLKRSKRWFPVIEPILKEYGVPDDFKYLCVIESYLSNVVSPAGAAGFWQFMKSTAQEYDLEISKEVDMRYNVELETEAACKYFLKAYERFGSWTLVAAAYNAGSTRVAKFMKEQGATSYYDLLMAEETERYVFRILAIKTIFENPEKYGIYVSNELSYQPYKYYTVKVDKDVKNWAEFAKEHDITYKLLKVFNPWLRSNSLKVKNGKVYEIKIPKKPFNITHGHIMNLIGDEQFFDNDSLVEGDEI